MIYTVTILLCENDTVTIEMILLHENDTLTVTIETVTSENDTVIFFQ